MEYTVQEETMQAIADAIRERSETSDPILTSDMPSLILTLKAKWGEITGDIEDQVDLNELFAKVNGYYEDMSVGSAEQLLSNTYEPDSTPYLYRTSGGSLEIGDRVYEDSIVGGSVAWNQLMAPQNITVDESVYSITSDNGTYTVTIKQDGVTLPSTNYKYVSGAFLANHVYLCLSHSDVLYFYFVNSIGTQTKNMYKPTQNLGMGNLRIQAFSTLNTGTYKITPQIFDLTLALGSTIADYVYTLESSEAGSGIAWLKSQGFFTKDYYAYNAGGIESVKTSAKKVVGFNQWDEVWEVGVYTSSGAKYSQNDVIRCKNMIPCLPNTTYYFRTSEAYTGLARRCFYDSDKQFISYTDAGVNRTFTTPQNACYMTFNMQQAYGTTYNNDICINLHWDGERDGEYEAYEEHTYLLGNDELRGLFKLSNGKIYADGDIKTSDGVITRRYWIVDLGTLSYSAYGATEAYDRYITSSLDSLIKDKSFAICAKFETVDSTATKKANCVWVGSGTSKVSFTTTVGAYASASAFKSAMSGTYLVYELATPTTESADPYTNPQLVDNWGTEEFVDTRDVPIPVGHDSRYLPDLKAKIESAPNNPSTNGKYFLQYQNGEATYVPVPSEVPQTPSEDGTYVLKATVSGGTATLSWVAEE